MLTASLEILHSSKHILITFRLFFSSGSKDLHQEVLILEPLKQSVNFSYQMPTDTLKNSASRKVQSTQPYSRTRLLWLESSFSKEVSWKPATIKMIGFIS